MKNILLNLIKIYKKASKLLWVFRPPVFVYSTCKFHPTCSEYASQAISKYGPFKGTIKSIVRILKCNPFSKGGVDLV